jgi:DNA-directed RNA polymerase specialized sigma subunit
VREDRDLTPRLNELAEKLKQQGTLNEEERKEFIEGSIGSADALAWWKVKRHAEPYPPCDVDDVIGESRLALVEAANNVDGDLHPTVELYVNRLLASQLYRETHREKTPVALPEKGYEAPPGARMEAEEDEAEVRKKIIAVTGEDKTDRQIVELRYKGLTDKQVAQRLGLHVSSVNQRRHTIQKRWVELYGPPPFWLGKIQRTPRRGMKTLLDGRIQSDTWDGDDLFRLFKKDHPRTKTQTRKQFDAEVRRYRRKAKLIEGRWYGLTA